MLSGVVASIVAQLVKERLPGVAEAVLDKGVDYVASKTGISLKPDMTAEEVEALRAAAQRHEEFHVEQANKNTADARAMQVAALAQGDIIAKRFVLYLAAFWSIVAALYIGAITFMPIPEENVRFADTVLGFLLGTIVATIMNFFMGSSSGSKNKDEYFIRGGADGKRS